MKKKGQVTIFIIIAIILIAGVALYFVFRDKISVSSYDSTSEPIVNFVQECIDQTFEDSLIAVAKQGGYSGYTYLEKTNEDGVTYYLLGGKDYMPSKKRVETEISEYFERKFFLCSRHFINFTDYQITEGNFESSTKINDQSVELEIRYPLTITKGGKTSRVKDFESEISIDFGIFYNSISNFINQQKQAGDKLCLSCFEMSTENNIYVDMESSYDKTVIFTFKDDYSELNNKPFEWVFANKYG